MFQMHAHDVLLRRTPYMFCLAPDTPDRPNLRTNKPPTLPSQVLEYYDLEHVNKWAWLGWEALFFVAFLAVAWAALSLVRHQRR